MRILQACPYSWHTHGGVQEHIAQLACALRRRGHEVAIVAPGEPGRSVEDGTTIAGAPVRIPFNGSVAPVCLDRAAVGRVRRLLGDFAPDVVHTHEPYSSLVTLASACCAAVPVVATYHCALDRRYDRALYFAVTRALWWVDRAVDVRIAVSDAAADTLRLGSDAPIAVLPNGVATADLAAVAAAPPPVDGPILFVGRLEPRKGVATLLAAMSAVWRRRPDTRLTVVGDGLDRRLVERLEPAVRHLVDLRGHCSRAELLAHYGAARLFIAPSLHGESFGMALLDAMAAARPVVASDIPAYRWLLDDGRAGRLATPGDGDAFAAAILPLLDAPDVAHRLGRAAAARAGDFDWDRIAAHLEGAYAAARDGVMLCAPRSSSAAPSTVRPCDAK